MTIGRAGPKVRRSDHGKSIEVHRTKGYEDYVACFSLLRSGVTIPLFKATYLLAN